MSLDLPPDTVQAPPFAPFRVPWTSDFIQDQFGVSVVLGIGNARQVFRWVPPGQFLMGSPIDEPQRGSAEVSHEVTLSRGF